MHIIYCFLLRALGNSSKATVCEIDIWTDTASAIWQTAAEWAVLWAGVVEARYVTFVYMEKVCKLKTAALTGGEEMWKLLWKMYLVICVSCHNLKP